MHQDKVPHVLQTLLLCQKLSLFHLSLTQNDYTCTYICEFKMLIKMLMDIKECSNKFMIYVCTYIKNILLHMYLSVHISVIENMHLFRNFKIVYKNSIK